MLNLLTVLRCLILIVLIFTVTPQTVAAQNVLPSGTLLLTDKYDEHFLSPYLSEYQISNINSVDQILAQDSKQLYNKDAQSLITIANDKDNIWLGFDSFNRSTDQLWALDFGYSTDGRFGFINTIRSYIINLDSFTIQEGKINPSTGRMMLEVPANTQLKILINIDGPDASPITLPLKIIKADQRAGFEDFILIYVLLAFLIAMAFFYGAMAFIHNNFEHLSFTSYYLILCAILIVQNSFVTFNYFFIGAGFLPFLYFAVAISALFSARKFWDFHNRSDLVKKAFYGFIGLLTVIFAIGSSLSLGNPLTEFIMAYGPTLLILTLIPVISVFLSQYGQEENTPFMFGWLILLFGIAVTILPFIGVMPAVSSAINAYWFAIFPQAIFFIIATKMFVSADSYDQMETKTVEINESDSVSKLRESREQIEQQRLLKVIDQERKVLNELRKSEARRTEEMRRAKEEADEANRAKSAFLAVVTHEIRTPMTGIMGMVRLLLESSLSKDQNQYAQTIQDSGDAMLALLNDILDFEKIEQGKMNFEEISFDLPRLITGVSTLMNGHALQKNIQLNTKLGDQLPRFVKGDPTRLRQVLLNLTGNAIKFTEEGQVTITAELINKQYDDESQQCEIYLSVTDSGIGISQEAQDNLFNPFAQADSSISRKFGGTGLGLAISNGLVKAMGSEININSKENEGSTFFFTLNMPVGHGDTITEDIRKPQTQQAQPSPNASPRTVQKQNNSQTITATVEKKSAAPLIKNKDIRILVVDDNFINQQVIKELFKKEQLNVQSVNSAEKALEILKNHKFDVVLMDIEMPGMNGDEATKVIRRSNTSNYQNLRIIALTGNLMPDHVEQYRKAGMDDVLAKPIDPEHLFSVVYATNSAPTAQQENKPEPPQEETGSSSALDIKTLDTLKGHLKNEDIKSMLMDVIDKNKEIIDQMRVEMESNNLEAIYARGHELKGMAGNFGLVELSQHAAIIEKKAKTGPSIMVANEINVIDTKRKSAEEALNQWINENLND